MLSNMLANRVSLSRGDDFAEGHRRPTKPSMPSMHAPRPMFRDHAAAGHLRKMSYDALRRPMDRNESNESSELSVDGDCELKVDQILAERDRTETVLRRKEEDADPLRNSQSQSGSGSLRAKHSQSLSRSERILFSAWNVVQCEMTRKRVLRSEYPLPHCTKKVAWTVLALWTVLCLVLVVVYGAHFDLVYDACAAVEGAGDTADCFKYTASTTPRGRRLMDDLSVDDDGECGWKSPMEDRLYQLILEYISNLIESDDFDLDGIPDHDDNTLLDVGIEGEDVLVGDAIDGRLDVFGADIADSDKWLLSCLVAVLLGFVVWQPLWLYLWAVLYVVLPPWCGVLRCTLRVCPCCFGYFDKMDRAETERERVISEKLQIKPLSDRSEGDAVSKQITGRFLAKPNLKGHAAVPSQSGMDGGDRELIRRHKVSKSDSSKREQRELELSEHYNERSKIVGNVRPTIIAQQMMSLQNRRSGSSVAGSLRQQQSASSSEPEDESPSSQMFGIGDDDVIYFQHANNRHRRGGDRIHSFRDWIVEYDDTMSVDTEQFLSDLSQ